MARILVVGAGMGALAAAARLASAGHRVTVCERSSTYGGAVGVLRRDGFSFDTGPVVLHLPAVYRDLFIKTGRGIRARTRTGAGSVDDGNAGAGSTSDGRTLEECVDLREVDPASRHLFPDGTALTLPNSSRAGVVRELDAAFGAGAGERWSTLMNRARTVWDTVRRPLLEEPLGDVSLLASDPYVPRRRPWLRRGEPTLADVARRELGHPGAVALLESCALRYGSDPRRAPASLVALAYMEESFGSWYPAGGMRSLADAVFRRCERRGVEFRFGARVVGLLHGDGRVRGVELADGTEVEADTVVSGIGAGALARLAGAPTEPGPSPAGSRASGGGRVVPGWFTVFAALRGPRPEDAVHRTVVHAGDRAAELTAVFEGGAPYERPTVEVIRPDDAGVRPDGAHEAVTLRVAVAPHGLTDWTADGLAARYAERVLGWAERAVPGLRDRALWYEVRTPADTERDTGAPGGSVPGPALAGGRGAFLAADNRSAVRGLYLVGGWAHPGGGLPHAGMSGAITAQLIGSAATER